LRNDTGAIGGAPGRSRALVSRATGGAVCFTLAVVLAACAASVETVPTAFVSAPGGEIAVARAVNIRLPTGYTRTLAEGSRWRMVGTVQQGQVYRAVGTVFTIEGRNVHEAYLVITAQRSLVGFYLPGESNLSMLSAPAPLSLKEHP
jgi:hypothetical protein